MQPEKKRRSEKKLGGKKKKKAGPSNTALGDVEGLAGERVKSRKGTVTMERGGEKGVTVREPREG